MKYFRLDFARLVTYGYIVVADTEAAAREKVNKAIVKQSEDTKHPYRKATRLSKFDRDIAELPEVNTGPTFSLRPLAAMAGNTNESASKAFNDLARLQVVASDITLKLARQPIRERQQCH